MFLFILVKFSWTVLDKWVTCAFTFWHSVEGSCKNEYSSESGSEVSLRKAIHRPMHTPLSLFTHSRMLRFRILSVMKMLQWTLVSCVFSNCVFVFFGLIPGSDIAGSHDWPIFNFWRSLPPLLRSGCSSWPSWLAVRQASLLSASSPVLVICCLYNCGPSDRGEVVSLRPVLGRCLLWVGVCSLHHLGFPGHLVPAPS